MFFVGKNLEIQTFSGITRAFSEEKRVFVPITVKDERDLIVSEIFNLDELEPAVYSILEPKKELVRLSPRQKMDLIIVPGLAFDRKGSRLGYGFGYYDNFLKKKSKYAKSIGLAFHFQIVESVPINNHDLPVDIIITEKEVIYCS